MLKSYGLTLQTEVGSETQAPSLGQTPAFFLAAVWGGAGG